MTNTNTNTNTNKTPPKFTACLHCSDNGKLACDHEPASGMTRKLNPDYVAALASQAK